VRLFPFSLAFSVAGHRRSSEQLRCTRAGPNRTYGPQVGACTPTAFASGVLPAAVSAAFKVLRSAPLIARHLATDFPRSLHADVWAASIAAVGAMSPLSKVPS